MISAQIRKNMHDSYKVYIEIILLFCMVFIIIPVSRCLAQEFGPEIMTELEGAEITGPEETGIAVNEETIPGDEEIVPGSEETMMEEQDETSTELIRNDYHYDPIGKRDPFYSKLLEEKKKIEPNKKLFDVQRYDLAELKLVGIIWGELGRKGVVETPEGKSYLVKVGTLVGKNGGVVKAITNQEVVIQEFVTDYLGNNSENITVMKIHHKEQEQ